MTGNDVHKLREKYRLDRKQFADLIGVSLSTVYRWEKRGYGALHVEPFPKRIMILMKHQVEEVSKPDVMIHNIARGIDVGGGLCGLYRLLQSVYDKRIKSNDQP